MTNVRILFVISVLLFCFVLLSFAQTNTNEVILPQTEFFAEPATSPVMDDRESYLPTKEEKKGLYEIPTIRSVDVLEKEAKKDISQDVKSRLIALFAYGLNDILDFSIIGLSQIPSDSVSISAVVKYNRFKRPDVVLYGYDGSFLNTFKELDLANVSIGVSSSVVFWSSTIEFFEDFKGLWSNRNYLDEKDRKVVANSRFRYRIDRDSTFNVLLELEHFNSRIRDRTFSYYYTSLNDFSLSVGYKYGIEEFNFFGIDFGIGTDVIKLTYDNDFKSGVYGDISFSFSFPIYENSWFVGLSTGILPNTFFPMEWYTRLNLGYRLSDNLVVFLSVFKDFEKFEISYLSRGLNFVTYIPFGDSSLGVELSPRFFFWGNNSIKLFIGYSYYFSKLYDKLQNDVYVVDITNVSALYSKVSLDVVSVEWFNLSAIYRFSLFIPFIPYVSIHSTEISSKFILGNFNLSFSVFGETSRWVDFGIYELYPYLGVSTEIEWEFLKNISVILKVDNILNNVIQVRYGSIISEPFYIQGGIKVKL